MLELNRYFLVKIFTMWSLKKYRNNVAFIAFKWAAVLFIVGSIYIYGTDALLDQYFDDVSLYKTFQTYKGIVFCGLIALILFFTIRHLLIKIDTEQQEVKKERRFAERIQNSIPGIFFVLDEAGRLIRWNDDTNIISGLSDKELKNVNAIERVEASDQIKAGNALQEVKDKGETETKLYLKTRSELKRLYKITASRFNNDGEQFIVGTGIDITQEHRLREELGRVLEKERERREKIEIDLKNLRDTFDQTPSPRCILEGPDHEFTYANESYKKLVDTKALVGKKLVEVIPEIVEQGFIEILDKVFHRGEPYVDKNKSVWIIKKDGSSEEHIFNLVYVPIKNEGDVYGIYCEGVEITEQIKANEKIKRQNYQLKTAQEIAQLGYWESNMETGKITWSNIVFELFGLDPKTFTPTVDNLLDLIHPDDKSIHEKNIEKLKKNKNFESEYRIIKPNGEISWFREIGEVYERKDNKPLILHGVVLDITPQKSHEKKIKRSYLQGENKERKRISNELHDGIAQYLSAALLHLDNAKELLENKNGTTQLSHARELVEKAVSETRTISQNLMPQTIERHGIISAVKLLIKQYRLSSNIQIYFDYNIEPEWSVNQEIETNLYRIVQEALSNALRHSGGDKIWIEIVKNTNHIICKITDNGRGLELREIYKSKGLGLQNIKDRVELLSGSIKFKNTSAQGLTVHIVIPVT